MHICLLFLGFFVLFNTFGLIPNCSHCRDDGLKLVFLYKKCWILSHVSLKVVWWCPFYDDVIKWKHYPRNWPFMWWIHRSPVNSRHKGQWRGALVFSLICAWINGWVNYRETGDFRRHRAHYDVTVMLVSIADMPLYEPTMAEITDAYIRHSAPSC